MQFRLSSALATLVLFTFGCDASSTHSMTEPAQDAHVASDAGRTMRPNTDAELDLAVDGGALTDQFLTTDATTMDATTPSPSVDAMALTPDSSLPPPVCPGDSETSCSAICDTLIGCLVGEDCGGLDSESASELSASCVESCGFNSVTQELLCSDRNARCETILEELYEVDESLNALCNYDSSFSESQQNACRDICALTQRCANIQGADAEATQTCWYQCLRDGNYNALDCISNLACDANFLDGTQACLQGRIAYPPLITDCSGLCEHIGECDAGQTIPLTQSSSTCIDACSDALSTDAQIACSGLLSCDLTQASLDSCVSDNQDAPTCNMACRRILECANADNPFGVTENGLASCIADCENGSSQRERRCSFETPCGSDYVDNLRTCGMQP